MQHGETALDYQRKVVPYFRDVRRIALKRAGKDRQRIWEGIAQRADVERAQAYSAGQVSGQ